MADKNIRQAVRDLHDRSRHDGEMQEAFQAHNIASARIRRNSEAVEKIPQPEIIQRDDILDDLSQLYAEQEEHDAEQVQCNKERKKYSPFLQTSAKRLADGKRSA